MLSTIAAAKNDSAARDYADSLENIDLLQESIHEKRDKDVFGMLIAGKVDVTETLASPLLKIWINLCSRIKEESLLTPLLNKFRSTTVNQR